MKKRLQVLMQAALPIFGALALYALKEYRLPENVFRRNARGVTVVEIKYAFSIGQGYTRLNANDAARFARELHLETHDNSDRYSGLNDVESLQLFEGNRLLARFYYVPGCGLKSQNGWWRDCYLLTPSSQRELNTILKKYGRRLR